ncbi:MAG: hypothetical protein HKN91_07240 [Acidimicrobiia bacterium]|nr:hypothetical protein [Acidimicrobiia bacterium]
MTITAARHPRFVVVGCGRSGTGWISTVLDRSGLPTGHETVYNPSSLRSGILPDWPPHLVGEASWLATPFVHMLPAATTIVHQVRHPVAVVRSFVRIRFFEEQSAYLDFVNAHDPDICRGSVVQRAVNYWLRWNALAELATTEREGIRHRLEDVSVGELQKLVDRCGVVAPSLQTAFETVSTTTNSRGDTGLDHQISVQDLLELPNGDELREVSHRYGYQL